MTLRVKKQELFFLHSSVSKHEKL